VQIEETRVMKNQLACGLVLFGCTFTAACGSDPSSNESEYDASVVIADAGAGFDASTGIDASTVHDASVAVDASGANDASNTIDASSGNDASATGDASSGADAGAGTTLTGTLGTLGAIKPTVSSFYIVNSGETLIYLTSAPLTCAQLTVSRWLGAFTKDAQVVEIVLHTTMPKIGTADHGAEVNFAAGGKSSAYETGASSASVTVTTSTPQMLIEGTVMATYPAGSLNGTFHAQFCANGQGY
jgi:hypothetical protein